MKLETVGVFSVFHLSGMVWEDNWEDSNGIFCVVSVSSLSNFNGEIIKNLCQF